jgi:hypothetical protein
LGEFWLSMVFIWSYLFLGEPGEKGIVMELDPSWIPPPPSYELRARKSVLEKLSKTESLGSFSLDFY